MYCLSSSSPVCEAEPAAAEKHLPKACMRLLEAIARNMAVIGVRTGLKLIEFSEWAPRSMETRWILGALTAFLTVRPPQEHCGQDSVPSFAASPLLVLHSQPAASGG